MSDLPEYVVRGGAQTFAPPILAKGTRMSTFALRADSDALVALVNKYLNGPGAAQTDLQFYPVGDYVFLAYARNNATLAKAVDRDLAGQIRAGMKR